MDAVLLDDDVFSYLTRTHDTRGDAYRPHAAGKTVAISFITVGKIYFGAEKRKWGKQTLNAFLGLMRDRRSNPQKKTAFRVAVIFSLRFWDSSRLFPRIEPLLTMAAEDSTLISSAGNRRPAKQALGQT